MKKVVTLAVAGLVLISMSACGEGASGTGQPTPSVTKNATNVETFKVPGGGSNDILVFDIERNGQTLTCTTKFGYNSGVGCVKK